MNKEILIAGEISRETFVKIMEESSGLTAADNLILKINSEGGSAFDGLAIYDALKNLPCSRTAEILGVCASAATLVAAACETRIIAPGAIWMVHRSHIPVSGNVDDLATASALLEKIDARMVEIYVAITGRDADAIRADISTENFMSAQTALAGGWVTGIAAEASSGVAAFDELMQQVRVKLETPPTSHFSLAELIARAGDMFRSDEAKTERKASVELAALKADFESVSAQLAAARADADAARAELEKMEAVIAEREQLAVAAALKNIGVNADDLPAPAEPEVRRDVNHADILKIGVEQGLAAAISAWYGSK